MTEQRLRPVGVNVNDDRIVPRAERPHVHVVNVDDAGLRGDRRANAIDVEVRRRRFEEHEERVAQESHRAEDENRGDEKARDGIGRDGPVEFDHDGRDERSDAPERVAEEMKARAAQVELVTFFSFVTVIVIMIMIMIMIMIVTYVNHVVQNHALSPFTTSAPLAT